MCAKFCGAWDKNYLDMDLRMSAGPILCYGGTPKFGPFFQLFGHFEYFRKKVRIIVCLSCIEQLLMGTAVEKLSF